MKAKTVKILSALALTAAVTAVNAENPANNDEYSTLVRKFTFDVRPYNLPTWQRPKSNVMIKSENSAGRHNSKCIVLDCSKAIKNSYATYLADIPCQGNTQLKLTGWVNISKDFTANAKMEFEMEFLGADKKEIPGSSKTVYATKDMYNDSWQRLTVTAQAPAGAKTVRLLFAVREATAGSVKIDDIILCAKPEKAVSEIEKAYTVLFHESTFDKVPFNWASWSSAKAGATYHQKVPAGRNNSKCLMIDASKAKPSTALYLNNFACEGGKKFFISVWMKASEEVSSNTEMALDVNYFDSNKKLIKTTNDCTLLFDINNGSWQRLTTETTAPANTASMRVLLRTRNAAPGKVWIDDVEIKTMP